MQRDEGNMSAPGAVFYYDEQATALSSNFCRPLNDLDSSSFEDLMSVATNPAELWRLVSRGVATLSESGSAEHLSDFQGLVAPVAEAIKLHLSVRLSERQIGGACDALESMKQLVDEVFETMQLEFADVCRLLVEMMQDPMMAQIHLVEILRQGGSNDLSIVCSGRVPCVKRRLIGSLSKYSASTELIQA